MKSEKREEGRKAFFDISLLIHATAQIIDDCASSLLRSCYVAVQVHAYMQNSKSVQHRDRRAPSLEFKNERD